jgi:hypothetical protein
MGGIKAQAPRAISRFPDVALLPKGAHVAQQAPDRLRIHLLEALEAQAALARADAGRRVEDGAPNRLQRSDPDRTGNG